MINSRFSQNDIPILNQNSSQSLIYINSLLSCIPSGRRSQNFIELRTPFFHSSAEQVASQLISALGKISR